MAHPTPTASSNEPLLTFGVIADVQYADCEDGHNFARTRTRYYRGSLNLLNNAVNDWKNCTSPLAFVIQLGDLIDGKNKTKGVEASKRALQTALQPLKSLKVPLYHLLGNHEFYNLDRSFYLTSPLNCARSDINTKEDQLYYTFLPHPKLRFVALDTYEVSVIGYADNTDNENYRKGAELFMQHNNLENPNDSSHLEGFEKRWTAYNGAVSKLQMQWLAEVLSKAQAREENVIIIGHVPILGELNDDNVISLLWNYEEVLQVLHNFNCVVGVICGHEHQGYQTVDRHGIQHITFHGIIETDQDSNAYAKVHLWNDQITVNGVGVIPNFSIPLLFPIR